MIERAKRRSRDLTCATVVVLMVAQNHFNIRSVRDIGPDDEGWYLGSGVLLGKPGFPNMSNGWPFAEQGPMYSLWYFVLSKIWRAPLELYFASWQALTTAVTLSIFVVLRRAGAPWWQALLACFFFVTSPLSDVWPFPTTFATLLVLVGIIVASFVESQARALATVTAALAFAGFARPEMLSAWGVAMLFVVVLGAREVRRSRQWRQSATSGAISAAPCALLLAVFGNPLGGMRSFYAFAQHYTMNLFYYTHSPLDPWDHWDKIVARDFPGTWTIGMAARANPSAFLAHIGRNVRELPRTFLYVTDTLDTSKSVQVVLLLIWLVFAVFQLRRSLPAIRANPVHRTIVFALLCAAVPFALSCLVIYPRSHYYVTVSVLALALLFATPFTSRKPHRRSKPANAAIVSLASAVLLLLTGSKSGDLWIVSPPKHELFGERQRMIAHFASMKLEGPVVALEESWGSCFYAGYQCTSRLRYEKETSFDAFVAQAGIDVIFIDPRMLQHPRFAGDPEFEDFLKDPTKHGFVIEPVPGTHRTIAVRSSRFRARRS
jgi:hypothetical protein